MSFLNVYEFVCMLLCLVLKVGCGGFIVFIPDHCFSINFSGISKGKMDNISLKKYKITGDKLSWLLFPKQVATQLPVLNLITQKCKN